MDFLTSYRILGLDPECDWDSARLRYQQLVSRHHPDRARSDADAATLAEINGAWRLLRHHYQIHGEMPLQPANPVDRRQPAAPFQPPRQTLGRYHRWLGLMIILLPLWVILMNLRQPASHPFYFHNTDPVPDMEAFITPNQPSMAANLHVGDPMGQVIEMLGPPDDTQGRRWYYGSSWIELTDGRVSDWHSSADHPLPTDTLSRPALP